MEIHILSSSDERRQFALSLEENRFTRGAGFVETEESSVGAVHLRHGRLCALFDENSARPKEMLAGAIFHNLASFPQSYPRPDLTHFSPGSVIECGELWSKAAGGAALMRQGTWILAGLLRVKAILIYPISKPWNLTFPYVRDFEKVDAPIEWPYIRGLNGERILIQPMVSQGEPLQRMILEASEPGFQANKELTHLRFKGASALFSGQLARIRAKDPSREGIFEGRPKKWRQQLEESPANDSATENIQSVLKDK